MTIYPQAILSMIEIDKANDTLDIVTSGGTFSLVPSYYTYANVIDLMYDLNSKLGANGDIYLMRKSNFAPGTYDTDFVPVVECASGTMTSISAGTIKDILFPSYSTDGDMAIATYTPLYCWIPEYRSKDGNWFSMESGSVVKGSIGVSGNLSGIAYTVRQKREIEWEYVAQTNCHRGGGNSYAQQRCFETVLNDARANSLVYAGSNNIYCKGVYYIHSITQYLGKTALSNSWGDGYPNAETYVFCSTDAPQISGQSTDDLNTYYNVSLNLTTATAPDWSN